jgi:CRAL/TRIO domain
MLAGYDKQHRPISWRKFGKFEIWNILKLTSMQQLINFHAWESEQLLRLMYTRSKETGCNIETFTVVIDASGWRLSQATGDAYTFIKGALLQLLLPILSCYSDGER